MNASKVKVGDCVSQEGKLFSFSHRKLNPSQSQRTVTEEKLMSIVEAARKCKNI
jgi:hypothetical protein